MKSFFSKKSILRTMAVAAVCMLGATSVKAQEFTIQGDFVSSYVWRGIYQGGAASFPVSYTHLTLPTNSRV